MHELRVGRRRGYYLGDRGQKPAVLQWVTPNGKPLRITTVRRGLTDRAIVVVVTARSRTILGRTVRLFAAMGAATYRPFTGSADESALADAFRVI